MHNVKSGKVHNYEVSPNGLKIYTDQFQAWYYIIAGLAVVLVPVDLILQSVVSGAVPNSGYWFLRSLGIITTVIGVIFLVYQRMRTTSWLTVLRVTWPVIIIILEFIGLVNSRLPAVFLIDMSLEVSFIVCWLIALGILMKKSNLHDERRISAGIR